MSLSGYQPELYIVAAVVLALVALDWWQRRGDE